MDNGQTFDQAPSGEPAPGEKPFDAEGARAFVRLAGMVRDDFGIMIGAAKDPRRAAVSIGVIVLGAKLSRADGKVSVSQMEMATEVFHVPFDELEDSNLLFRRASTGTAGYEAYAKEIADVLADRPKVLEKLHGALILVAQATGHLTPNEQEFLDKVGEIFRLTPENRRHTEQAHASVPEHPDGASMYAILGVAETVSNKALKKAFHKLARENHPDSLIGQGMPPELVRVAEAKMAMINMAYDWVVADRGKG